jgi:prevent-host-death family protein
VRRLKIAEDVVPIGEFKTHASELIRRMHESGRGFVITQSGRPTAVVLTPEDFDELGYREHVRTKVRAATDAIARGTLSTEAARSRAKAKVRGT